MRVKGRVLISLVLLGLLSMACAAPAAPTPTPTTAPKAAPPATTAAPAAPAPAAKPTAAPAAAAPTAAPKAAAPKTLTKLKVAYAASGANGTPVWIAKEQKLFEKYGLDVEMSYIASATTAMAAMLSGDVPVLTSVNAAQVIGATVEGADAVIIGNLMNTVAMYIYVSPSVQSPADLKGKSMGVTRLGSLTHSVLRFALRKLGLDPERDVTVVQMGGVPEILAGMQSGAIIGGSMSMPTNLKAKEAGFKELMDVGASGFPYPQGAMATTRKYASANAPVLLNILRAVIEGTYLFKTNKQLAMTVIGKYTETDDKQMLESTYDAFVGKVEKLPYPSRDAMQTGVDEVALSNAKAKGANPDQFIDLQYVKQLEDSGFIKQIYKE